MPSAGVLRYRCIPIRGHLALCILRRSCHPARTHYRARELKLPRRKLLLPLAAMSWAKKYAQHGANVVHSATCGVIRKAELPSCLHWYTTETWEFDQTFIAPPMKLQSLHPAPASDATASGSRPAQEAKTLPVLACAFLACARLYGPSFVA